MKDESKQYIELVSENGTSECRHGIGVFNGREITL